MCWFSNPSGVAHFCFSAARRWLIRGSPLQSQAVFVFVTWLQGRAAEKQKDRAGGGSTPINRQPRWGFSSPQDAPLNEIGPALIILHLPFELPTFHPLART